MPSDSGGRQHDGAIPLRRLLEGLPVRIVSGDGDLVISGVADDSRRVRPGDLFVARPGTTTDGRAFVDDAVARGAVAVLAADPSSRGDVAVIVPTEDGDVVRLTGELAQRVHGSPGRALRLVGITGTNGKTTTAWLVQQILRRAGARCGLVGTIDVDDGRERVAAELTTPGAVDLARLLRRMVDNGCGFAVLEVSSHALAQKRVDALPFEVGVFTNLSGDHLDYHRTGDAYIAAKRRLFELLQPGGTAVINADDAVSDRMLEACRGRVIRCRRGPGDADARVTVRRTGLDGTDVVLEGPWGDPAADDDGLELHLPLVGAHNAVNALQAAAVAAALGVEAGVIAAALADATAPPGRLEPVRAEAAAGAPAPCVLVDYAHTDDALANVLASLRPLVPDGGRLRAVFGCGGDRDRSKRARMARCAWRYADEVIVTSDNPRTEDPEAIIDDILAGVPDERRAATGRFVDRRAAIDEAVRRSGPDDLVLIAGKGHEDYQIIGTERHPFDDRDVARAALAAWVDRKAPAASVQT